MIELPIVREFLRYSEWANEKLFAAAEGLTDAQLDHPFEMGPGSLRRTLLHILSGESVWLQRWQERAETRWPDESEKAALPELKNRFEACYAERRRFLDSLDAGRLEHVVRYRDSKGAMYEAGLGEMLMQVCVHSQHHRTQALNMLRHLGAALPRPGLDYVFMVLETGGDHSAACRSATLRTFYGYGDWGNAVVLDAAAGLSDAQLDQPFDMGPGSLRKTLLHIRAAEQWWLENWTLGPGRQFPDLSVGTSVADLRGLWQTTKEQRDAVLAARTDVDLEQIVEAHPRPGVIRRLPMGVTMLQLCGHGVHHRAQAVNMIRRLGPQAPELDYMYHVRVAA